MSSASSTSVSGNVTIGEDAKSNLWRWGIAGLVIVLLVWLATRKG